MKDSYSCSPSALKNVSHLYFLPAEKAERNKDAQLNITEPD